MNDRVHISHAQPDDADDVWRLLRELAVYEEKVSDFHLTVSALRFCLWGPRPVAGALLARAGASYVGVALHYPTFPSFSGAPALFLEDLFVLPAYRRRGIGRALLQACIDHAAELDCGSVRWWALDWNNDAMNFYKAVGARTLDACVVHQLPVTPADE